MIIDYKTCYLVRRVLIRQALRIGIEKMKLDICIE